MSVTQDQVGKYATAGATVGSVVPAIGTTIGAITGTVTALLQTGALSGLFKGRTQHLIKDDLSNFVDTLVSEIVDNGIYKYYPFDKVQSSGWGNKIAVRMANLFKAWDVGTWKSNDWANQNLPPAMANAVTNQLGGTSTADNDGVKGTIAVIITLVGAESDMNRSDDAVQHLKAIVQNIIDAATDAGIDVNANLVQTLNGFATAPSTSTVLTPTGSPSGGTSSPSSQPSGSSQPSSKNSMTFIIVGVIILIVGIFFLSK